MIRTRTVSLFAASCLLVVSCSSSDDAAVSTSPVTASVDADAATDTDSPTTDASVAADPPATDAPAETDPPATDAPADTDPPTTDAVPELPTDAQPFTEQPRGTDGYVSTQSFDDTVASAVAAIEGNDAITLVATIDHSANAEAVGIELPPTTELIFGNPALGTPLMQQVPTVGIDLPQKLLVLEDLDGTVTVLWNRSEYLASRHGLSDTVDEQLSTIDGALLGLGAVASGIADDVAPIESVTVVGELDGVIETTTSGTAREAADRLLAAIDGNPDLTLVAEIDHGANAAAAGLELSPIIEVVFGNPNLGSPLMLASRSIAIDLPQKMLFIEDGDGVRILYNDPAFIAKRHRIDTDVELVATISAALETLAAAAAG